jgi:hypothetical protein
MKSQIKKIGKEVFSFLKTNYAVQKIDVAILFDGKDERKYISFPAMKRIKYFPFPAKISEEPIIKGKTVYILETKDDCRVVVRIKVKELKKDSVSLFKILVHLFYSLVVYHDFLEKSEALGHELVNVIPQSSPSEALIWAMKTCVELTGGDAGSITVYDKVRGKMTFPYFYKMPPELTRFEVEFGKGLSSDIVRTKRGYIINDYQNYPNRIDVFVKAGVKSIVGAPVVYGDNIYGAIGVFAMREKKKFLPSDLTFVEAVGRVVGAILYKISLEKEVTLEAREHIDKLFFYENLVSLLTSEIITPLRLILGFSSILKEDLETMQKESLLKYIETIYSSASKLENTIYCLTDCIRTITIWEPLAPVDTKQLFENLSRIVEKTYPFVVVQLKNPDKFPTLPARGSHMRFVFNQIFRYLARFQDYRGKITVSNFKKKGAEVFIFEAKGKPLPKRDVELFIVRNCVDTYLGSIWWDSKKGTNKVAVSIRTYE